MKLHSLTRAELIFPNLPGNDSAVFLRVFADRLAEEGLVADAEELYDRLCEREQLGSTGIGFGVAIPHCKMKGLEQVVLAVATSREGVEYGAVDGKPVRLFFMVLSPVKDPAAHLQSLAAISKWVRADEHVERILQQEGAEAIHQLLQEDSEAS